MQLTSTSSGSFRNPAITDEDLCSPDTLATVLLSNPDCTSWLRSIPTLGRSLATKLVQTLVDRAQKELRRNPKEAARIAGMAVEIASAAEDAPGRITSLSILAQAHLANGQPENALDSVELAAADPGAGAHTLLLGRLDALRMKVLTRLRRFDEARDAGRRALSTFENGGDVAGTVRAHLHLGALESFMGRKREALWHQAAANDLLHPRP